jgi:hypothetical protein
MTSENNKETESTRELAKSKEWAEIYEYLQKKGIRPDTDEAVWESEEYAKVHKIPYEIYCSKCGNARASGKCKCLGGHINFRVKM